MKTILLISLGIILVIVAVVVFRWRRRAFKSIRPVLTVNPIYITPDLPIVKMDTRKEDLFVREGLDFIKVSTKTIRDPKLLFFETYSPEEPTRKKRLILAEYVNIYEAIFVNVDSGVGIIYTYNGTAYLGKSKIPQTIESDGMLCLLATDNGTMNVSSNLVCGVVKKVYGDYKLEKKS